MNINGTAPSASINRLRSPIITSKYPWYTDAVLTLPNFVSCVASHEELIGVAIAFELFESRLFTSDDSLYVSVRHILQYDGEDSTPTTVLSQTSPSMRKYIDLMMFYRLFDRLWLYLNPSLWHNVTLYPNTLSGSSFQSWAHLGNIKRILLKLRSLVLNMQQGTLSAFNTKIVRDVAAVAQLKQLLNLQAIDHLRKIQRNLLMAALSINCIIDDSRATVQSKTAKHSTHDSDLALSEIRTINLLDQNGDKMDVDYISCLSELAYERGPDISMANSIHKTLQIMVGISPILLLASLSYLNARWPEAAIYKEGCCLGNIHSPFLIKIESIIMNAVLSLANGTLNADEAIHSICNDLPWDEIENLAENDPSNRRFCTGESDIERMADYRVDVHNPVHTVYTPTMDQIDTANECLSKNIAERPNAISSNDVKGDNSVTSAPSAEKDIQMADISAQPVKSSSSQTFSGQSDVYIHKGKEILSREENTMNTKKDRRIKSGPFQDIALTSKSLDITLTIEDEPAPSYQLPPFTMYDAYGKPHEVVFRSHHPKQTDFWKKNLVYVQNNHINGNPPHVHDIQNKSAQLSSIFTIVKHADLAQMSVQEKLSLFKRGLVVETDRPTDRASFDKPGFKKIGCSSSKIVTIQDQSIDGSVSQNNWLRQGTLGMLLKAKGMKGMNVLDLPTPGGKQTAEDFSSDSAAWRESIHSVWNIETKAGFPRADTRWVLISASPCGHTYHVDSDGFVWFAVRPKTISIGNATDFSEFYKINRFLDSSFDLYDPGNDCAVEALPLIPGCRLYMRPNTGHSVFTAEDTIVIGGHYYATSTMKDTLCALILAFAASDYITNTEHLPSRQILRFMMIFYFDGLEQKRFLKDDPVVSHLPKLDPLSTAPDFNTITEFETLFSMCCLAIFSNVLHPLTYLHADEAGGNVCSVLSGKQLLEMELYDRNALSIEERNACALSRSLAFSLLEWFSTHYAFSRNNDEVTAVGIFIEKKIAEQAYAIYCTKKTAEKQNLNGALRCSTSTLKRQLMGTFDHASNIHKWISTFLENDTHMEDVTPTFEGYELHVINPAPEYTPKAATTYDWMRTPLDIKFQEGYNNKFKYECKCI
ncbi:hypothetical protein BDN70DRAFT_901903 [Pholiota conissans]|uniref:JmjC domain-containing protein n=1 Tax=Pholiota conissans TaxID=109636 RepID=A0A9P5YLC6_9AGAR|nr:hypothetical protein BDN70DRAFT_901903 [Pholiota conissans]